MKTYDLIIIGTGPAGYVAAIRAAQLGMKVACIEKNADLGGTCLNVGCIPSKALLHASHLYSQIQKEAPLWGIHTTGCNYSLTEMMGRKDKIIQSFRQGIKALFKKYNITLYCAQAQFISPTEIEVNEEKIEAKYSIIATGSIPVPLPFMPFDGKKIISSTEALSLMQIPKRLTIIGAGVIGVELGSVYQRLGSQVEIIEFLDRICPFLDKSIGSLLQKSLESQGIIFRLSSKVTEAKIQSEEIALTINQSQTTTDVVLVAIGRKPYTQGLGLDKLGITLNAQGQIPVDSSFKTSAPTIFAIGDVIDGPMLAHKASEEGVAVVEMLAGKSPEIDYLTIPNVIYTSPEVASVGLTEEEAIKAGFSIKTGSFPFAINSRAKCTGEEEGLVKVIADQKTDRLLAVHILGAHASELISEASLALKERLTTLEFAHSCRPHPTLSESLKEAALAVHQQAIHR